MGTLRDQNPCSGRSGGSGVGKWGSSEISADRQGEAGIADYARFLRSGRTASGVCEIHVPRRPLQDREPVDATRSRGWEWQGEELMRMRMFSMAGLALVVSAGTTFGKEVTGRIAGNVLDKSGAGVPNASVTVTNTDQNIVIRTLETSDRGEYVATFLPVGHYAVTVEAKGFKKTIQTGIMVNVNDKLTVNLTLDVRLINETVTVEANAVQVDQHSVAAAGLVSGAPIRELALNGRNWEDLIILNPGVADAVNSDQLYVGVFAPQGTSLVTFSMNGGPPDPHNPPTHRAQHIRPIANP